MFLCMTLLNVILTNVCYMNIMIISLLTYMVVAHIRCNTVLMLFGSALVKYLRGTMLLPI
jgi:hypothetical protein